METGIVIAVVVFLVLVYFALKSIKSEPVARRDQDIKLTIRNLGGHLGKSGKRRSYTAVKIKGRKGTVQGDWAYFDEAGDLIDDIILITLLFDVFENEDWDSDRGYSVDDYQYFEDSVDVDSEDVVTEESTYEAPTYQEPTYEAPTYEEPEETKSYDSSSDYSSGSDYSSDSGSSDFGGCDD